VATKFFKIKPHRTTMVYQVPLPDKEARINYCRWFQQSLDDGMVDSEFMF
jgi:hypothetical protein